MRRVCTVNILHNISQTAGYDIDDISVDDLSVDYLSVDDLSVDYLSDIYELVDVGQTRGKYLKCCVPC